MGYNRNTKPQMWGPPGQVSMGVQDYCENPLGVAYSDLALAMPMWGPGKQFDYSKNSFEGVNSGAAYEKNRLSFVSGDSDSVIVNATPITDYPITLITHFTPIGSGGATARPFNYGRIDYDERYYALDANIGNDFSYWFRSDAQGSIVYTTETPATGIEYMMVGVSASATNHKLYIDGKLKGSSTTATIFSASSTANTRTGIGALIRKTPIYSTCQVLSSYLFSVALTPDQIALLNDDPYGMWQPKAWPVYFFTGAAAPSTYARPSRALYGPFLGPLGGPV